MVLHHVLGFASRMANSVADILIPTARRVSVSGARAHIEVHGLHRPGTEEAAQHLEQRLRALEGVGSAELNAVLGRVVVAHDGERVAASDLVRVVGEIERELCLGGDIAPASGQHPANLEHAFRELLGLGLNLTGLGLAMTRAVLPVPRLSPLVPGLLSLVDSAPRLHAAVEAALGRPAGNAALVLGGAVSNVFGSGPLALLTTAGQRLCLHREASARRQAWERFEDALAGTPDAHRAAPLDVAPRPVPVPPGAVERVADRSTALALAGYAATLAATRSADRALGVLLAGIPRAATAGREAFAAQLGHDLCTGGGVVLDADALRRLDRVDTVVLDAPALLTGQRAVDEVHILDEGGDGAELVTQIHDLVDPEHPGAAGSEAGWSVRPVAGLAGELPEAVRRAARERSGPGAIVLAVLHRSRPVGLVTVRAELHPLAEAVVAAARTAGTVLVAGIGSGLDRRLEVDGTIAGGNRLPGAVRRLQADGHVVAVLSARSGTALAAADVGIGLLNTTRPPWGAHVLCDERVTACVLLHAVSAARAANKRSALLSGAGSAVGASLVALGPAAGAPDRAAFPVHVAALLALVAGTWSGRGPARQPAPVAEERTPWHALSVPAALSRLGSSPDGLAEQEAARRARPAEDDDNGIGLVRAAAEELANPLTPALAAGAGISASLGSVVDALMITGVLGVNALIGGAQRLGADRALRALGDDSAGRVRLRREGVSRTVRTAELVPGDVIELQSGDAVPADCRLVEAANLEVDESSLTGESEAVEKSVAATAAQALADRHCMLYQGTVVAAGRAVGLVVATGERTEVGRTARSHGDEPVSSGVAIRLRSLARATLPISMGSGVVLFAADLLRGRPINHALSRAVSLAVAAIPEGLPFVATVAELAAARRLSARGALVRNPSTIEALGRVDMLCFDKTGTLTEGRIRLRLVSDGRTTRAGEDLPPDLRRVVAVAVRASPWHGAVPHQTDRAVLAGAETIGVSHDEALTNVEHVDELVFEPSRGYHAVLWRHQGGCSVSVKGAPEEVLARCTGWRRPDGRVAFDSVARAEVDAEVDRLARQGHRVLAVAEQTTANHPDSDRTALTEPHLQDLELCGLLGLADPVRPTAGEAVDILQRAGVDVLMITGDHPSTAEAVAAELGVLDGRRVVTGTELDSMDDGQLTAVLPEISVFARVSPAQKARIVRRLRCAERVVAVTGDGANDAPAIRLADVGIALGSRATPAAREAADVVVTDDRIETITDAIVEGRAMWSSVREALSILLGGNLGEIGFTVGAGLLSGGDALNARQLLLVNLLTDVLPAMAVAVRPPPSATADDLLAEGPEASLGTALTRDIYRRAATTAAAAGLGWMLTRPVGTPRQAGTTALVALVGAQLGQTIALPGRTPLVVTASAGSLAALAMVVQIPGISHFFGCRPLLPHQWAIGLGAAAATTVAGTLWQRAR